MMREVSIAHVPGAFAEVFILDGGEGGGTCFRDDVEEVKLGG